MWMVNKIFHAMYDIKESGLYWGIHVSTETHGRVLIFVPSLNSDVNEANNPVIKGYSMQVINLFQLLSNNRCSHEERLFKVCVYWER